VRILLDENVPHPLMRFLSGHEVSTVQGLGWRGILNGELLRIAEESFDVFILADKNMRYQQNMDWRYGILSAPNYSCAAFRLRPSP
jgi:hypothetical protein